MKIYIYIAAIIWFAASCTQDAPVGTPKPKNWNLKFDLNVSGEPISNSILKKYLSPSLDTFTIHQFKCYISNIKLINKANASLNWREKESYHLIGYDNGKIVKDAFVLENVPAGVYDQIEFSIGVDSIANSKITRFGDLDHNSNMAWDWEIGYKFILLEGNYATSKPKNGGLVVHIGENINYKTVKFDLKSANREQEAITFNVDINKIFEAPHPIDFDVTNDIMFGINAKRIAENYATGLFAIKE